MDLVLAKSLERLRGSVAVWWIIMAVLLLMAFTVAMGRPLLYPDTKAYYALGQQIGVTAKLVSPETAAATLRGAVLSPLEQAVQERLAYTVAAARSVFYSAYLFFLHKIGTMWLVVFVQAACAAVLLFIISRVTVGRQSYVPLVAVLAVLSSLPMYIGSLMPDIFASLGILSAAILIMFPKNLSFPERMFCIVVLFTSCVFHSTHLVLLMALGLIFLIASKLPIIGNRAWTVGAGTVCVVSLAAGLSGMVYPLAVHLIKGEKIYSPPFIAARLIADGPGRDYLRRACAEGSDYALCAYRDLPLEDSNDILWQYDPTIAVFQVADYGTRVRIVQEQPRFVLSTIASDPFGVAAASLWNAAQLFVMYQTDEVLHDPDPYFQNPRYTVFGDLVPGGAACRAGAASCAPQLPPSLMNVIVGAGLLISIGLVIYLLASSRQTRAKWLALTLFILLALVLNAALCGAVSGPYQRYQSRLTWLLPMLAFFLLVDFRKTRRS